MLHDEILRLKVSGARPHRARKVKIDELNGQCA